jgi:hypothetical protein
LGYWYQVPAGNGSRHPVYGYPKEREFTVKRHGRIEPVHVDDFDELDVFKEFVMYGSVPCKHGQKAESRK